MAEEIIDKAIAAAKSAADQKAAMEATYAPHVGKTFKHNDPSIKTTWEVKEYMGIQGTHIRPDWVLHQTHCYKTRQYNPDQVLVVPCAEFLATRTAQEPKE